MNNPIFTVTKFEVIRQLKKPSFWIALLLLPVLLLGIVGISALSSSSTSELLTSTDIAKGKTLALTDEAGVIDQNLLNPESLKSVLGTETTLKTLPDQTEGIKGIKSGAVDIYYYIPKDFLETKQVEYYTHQDHTALAVNYETPLRALLSASAYAKTEPAQALILTSGYKMHETTFSASGEEVNLLGQAIIPLVILAIFYVLVCVFGNRLLMTVVEEKENRISEMILTAVSARHLIIGKIIALILLGFLQIAVFIIPVLAILFIYRDNPMVANILSIVEWNPTTILMNALLLVFSYFLFAGASTFVGALVPTARDASQFIAPVMIGTVLPLFFIQLFIAGEPSVITYLLSYFPLSAPIAMMLRNAFGTLPAWEFLLGVVEIAAFSALSIHLTVKTFQKNAINFSVTKPTLARRKTWK